MHSQYEDYLKSHRAAVLCGFDWLCARLPEVLQPMSQEQVSQLRIQIEDHDLSKYSSEEFSAYEEYFYGGHGDDKPYEVEVAMNEAWLHHQKLNPHHWQYWVLIEDSGKLIPQDMPLEYMIELICDWWSFSWVHNDKKEIFKWYNENKKNILLSNNTREYIEAVLGLMKGVLEHESAGWV